MADQVKEQSAEPAPGIGAIKIIVPAGGMYEVYSNFININWTPYDVRIRFAQIVPVEPSVAPRIPMAAEERAAVTLAWAEAKFLRDLLSELITKYEAANGELKPAQIEWGTPPL